MRDSWRSDVVLAERLELRGGRLAPAEGRATVAELLGDRVGAHVLLDVCVLVSEMITNAVRHGGAGRRSTVVVHVAIAEDVLRVEVCDDGLGFARPRVPRRRADGGGNGLVLLDRMSNRWGVATGTGTCVWFERELAAGDYP